MSCGKKLGRALVHSKTEPPICDRCDALERQLAEALEEARQFRKKIQRASDQYGYSHSDKFMDAVFAILEESE